MRVCICFFPSKWLIVSVANLKNPISQRFETLVTTKDPGIQRSSSVPLVCSSNYSHVWDVLANMHSPGPGLWRGGRGMRQVARPLQGLLSEGFAFTTASSNGDKNFTPQRLRENQWGMRRADRTPWEEVPGIKICPTPGPPSLLLSPHSGWDPPVLWTSPCSWARECPIHSVPIVAP